MGVWPAADALEPSGRWIHAKATVTPRLVFVLRACGVSVQHDVRRSMQRRLSHPGWFLSALRACGVSVQHDVCRSMQRQLSPPG
eukprot:1157778-Pelagomonas_calceolata.AAC.1